jgi:hypothetical protein
VTLDKASQSHGQPANGFSSILAASHGSQNANQDGHGSGLQASCQAAADLFCGIDVSSPPPAASVPEYVADTQVAETQERSASPQIDLGSPMVISDTICDDDVQEPSQRSVQAPHTAVSAGASWLLPCDLMATASWPTIIIDRFLVAHAFSDISAGHVLACSTGSCQLRSTMLECHHQMRACWPLSLVRSHHLIRALVSQIKPQQFFPSSLRPRAVCHGAVCSCKTARLAQRARSLHAVAHSTDQLRPRKVCASNPSLVPYGMMRCAQPQLSAHPICKRMGPWVRN